MANSCDLDNSSWVNLQLLAVALKKQRIVLHSPALPQLLEHGKWVYELLRVQVILWGRLLNAIF